MRIPEHIVRRVDVLHDVGRPAKSGAGDGMADARGSAVGCTRGLQSHSASTYVIPAIRDAPADFRVKLFQGSGQPGGVHRSRGIGEPPLMLAILVREALGEAVLALGGDEKLAAPATAEAILLASRRRG